MFVCVNVYLIIIIVVVVVSSIASLTMIISGVWKILAFTTIWNKHKFLVLCALQPERDEGVCMTDDV